MKGYKKEILLLVLLIVTVALTSCIGGPDIEDVRAKIEKALYEKYGEEFVVDQIGTRSANGDKFYQARIYPKSIVGTNKEGDDYYYGSASVDISSFGKLGGVGDSYPLVKLKLDIENHLIPKATDIFGKRILMSIEAHYKRREPGNVTYWGYKVSSYKEARKLIAEDPDNRMIELELDLYIFNRIDDVQEKERRRQEIYNFVQYLKDEGLFKFLELGVIFIDERVLAPSYQEYSNKVYFSDKVMELIEGETVRLPPMELRKEMSKVLLYELDEMTEKELLISMRQIKKNQLSYDNIGKYNEQYFVWICSLDMLKINNIYLYEKYKKENKLEYYKYNTSESVLFAQDNKYIY